MTNNDGYFVGVAARLQTQLWPMASEQQQRSDDNAPTNSTSGARSKMKYHTIKWPRTALEQRPRNKCIFVVIVHVCAMMRRQSMKRRSRPNEQQPKTTDTQIDWSWTIYFDKVDNIEVKRFKRNIFCFSVWLAPPQHAHTYILCWCHHLNYFRSDNFV